MNRPWNMQLRIVWSGYPVAKPIEFAISNGSPGVDTFLRKTGCGNVLISASIPICRRLSWMSFVCATNEGKQLRGVEDRLSGSRVASRERASLPHVSAQRVNAHVAEACRVGREELVGRRYGVAADRRSQRLSIDREVDGAPELRVVPEERPPRIENEHARSALRRGKDEELRSVDAVPAHELIELRRRREREVGLSLHDPLCRRLERAGEVDDEAVDVLRAAAAIEGVASEDDLPAGYEARDVVRARSGQRRADPLGVERKGSRDRAEPRQDSQARAGAAATASSA